MTGGQADEQKRNSEIALLRYARNDNYFLLLTKRIVIARNEVTKQSEKYVKIQDEDPDNRRKWDNR